MFSPLLNISSNQSKQEVENKAISLIRLINKFETILPHFAKSISERVQMKSRNLEWRPCHLGLWLCQDVSSNGQDSIKSTRARCCIKKKVIPQTSPMSKIAVLLNSLERPKPRWTRHDVQIGLLTCNEPWRNRHRWSVNIYVFYLQ